MKIIPWNVNGIRSAEKQGFVQWFKKIDADVVCLQEVRAYPEQLSPNLADPDGYFTYFNSASKKGYSGVAVYSKQKPKTIGTQIGFKQFDGEGRILILTYPNFTLINLYLPHGGRQKEKLDYKLKVYKHLLNYLEKIKDQKVILTGDFNIAHKEIDLTNSKQNKNNIMFTEEERKQIDKIVDLGFTDSFRKFNKKGGNYTWWAHAFNARERNIGWRIDYVFTSKNITKRLKNAYILNTIEGSDHCPVGVNI